LGTININELKNASLFFKIRNQTQTLQGYFFSGIQDALYDVLLLLLLQLVDTSFYILPFHKSGICKS